MKPIMSGEVALNLKSYSYEEEQSCGEQRHSQVLGPVVSTLRTVDTLWVVGVDRRRCPIHALSTHLTSSVGVSTHYFI